jgi:hypothetical protein
MKVTTWHHNDLRSEFPESKNLKELMSAINKKLWIEECVICEVKLNNIELNEEVEIEKASLPVSQILCIEVMAQTLPELITDSVATHIKFIPRIKAAAIECSEEFRSQNLPLGKASLVDVLESCQWMTEALSHLKESIKQWDGFMEFGPDWGEKETQYSTVVNELVHAYQSSDVQLLADVLEYELANSLDGWVEVFEKIQRRIEDPESTLAFRR